MDDSAGARAPLLGRVARAAAAVALIAAVVGGFAAAMARWPPGGRPLGAVTVSSGQDIAEVVADIHCSDTDGEGERLGDGWVVEDNEVAGNPRGRRRPAVAGRRHEVRPHQPGSSCATTTCTTTRDRGCGPTSATPTA